MKIHKLSAAREQLMMLPFLGRWVALATVVGGLSGSASALFLWSLELATDTRLAHPWLLWLLPVGGFVVGWLYLLFGQSVEGGNNLLIDEIHDPKKVIPLRMAPLVFLGTVATHLFGGSAGREGTSVQMGGALADQLTHFVRLDSEERRVILMTGISAGFSSVFGTPLAGAIFGLEVLAVGRLRYDALLPCFVGAIVGDLTTRAWGIHHTEYVIASMPPANAVHILLVIAAGAVFGVAGMLFAEGTHATSALFKKAFKFAPLRPFAGGILVALAATLIGTPQYLGLGIPTIVDAFHHQLPWYDFLGKAGFTILTLGSGFKGGEVTPLFYIGATLGNALSHILPLAAPVLAGLGFVAVFAGAANTPIASTVMAIEIFGPQIGAYAAIACVVSYLFSGHTGIYRAQRIGHAKRISIPEGLRLSEIHAFRRDSASRPDTSAERQ